MVMHGDYARHLVNPRAQPRLLDLVQHVHPIVVRVELLHGKEAIYDRVVLKQVLLTWRKLLLLLAILNLCLISVERRKR